LKNKSILHQTRLPWWMMLPLSSVPWVLKSSLRPPVTNKIWAWVSSITIWTGKAFHHLTSNLQMKMKLKARKAMNWTLKSSWVRYVITTQAISPLENV
jgi:hypothetical protein